MDIIAFLCHSSRQSKFVIEVGKFLRKSLKEIFLYEEHQRERNFIRTINRKLVGSNVMIIFIDEPELKKWQLTEIDYAIDNYTKTEYIVINVIKKDLKLEAILPTLTGAPKITIPEFEISIAKDTAFKILEKLNLRFEGEDGLPYNPQLFSYEKDILKYFKDKIILERKIKNCETLTDEDYKKLDMMRDYTLKGCPSDWVYISTRHDSDTAEDDRREVNKDIQQIIGNFRPESAQISVDARIDCDYESSLYFLEAGPRQRHYFPLEENNIRIAIMVSGGIAPGINSVIDGITQRHELYAKKGKYEVEIFGLINGFFAFEDIIGSRRQINRFTTREEVNQGGSMLGTSRVEELIDGKDRVAKLKGIIEQLRVSRIDILYIIGGEGSMRAAHALHSIAQNDENGERKLSVVAIPKTMDNDILWMWQSFGFVSAVERAREVIENLATEVKSNPRLCIVQLFGSNSGFIVSHAVLASKVGSCDAALIPEEDFSMKWLKECITERIIDRHKNDINLKIPFGLIVMSETAIPTDAEHFFGIKSIGLTKDEKSAVRFFLKHKKDKLGFQGKTSDHLRSAGLKIIEKGLEYLFMQDSKNLKANYDFIKWGKLRVFTNEPRHLLRSAAPSTLDIINGSRLGTLAVDNAMAGYTDFMISQWLTEFVLVPLKLVTLGRKQIPSEGIFWKSVLAKTGQGKYLPKDEKKKQKNAKTKEKSSKVSTAST